jgi:hypothetical protein
MPDLCTVEEALLQIRGDETADGAWLGMWIPVVSQAVADWLKDEFRLYTPMRDSEGAIEVDSDGHWVPEEDSNGPVVNPLCKAAALLELSSQYRFREGEGDNVMPPHAGYGYTLSRGATALLTSIRKPTVA